MGAVRGQEAEVAADRAGAGRRGGGAGEEFRKLVVVVEVDEDAGKREREQVGAQEAAAFDGVTPGLQTQREAASQRGWTRRRMAASTSSGRRAGWSFISSSSRPLPPAAAASASGVSSCSSSTLPSPRAASFSGAFSRRPASPAIVSPREHDPGPGEPAISKPLGDRSRRAILEKKKRKSRNSGSVVDWWCSDFGSECS
jgi:hypothetical protein